MGKVAVAAKIVCTAAVCAAAVLVARRQMKSSGRWAKAEAILKELEENCGCPTEKLRQVVGDGERRLMELGRGLRRAEIDGAPTGG
ncbi:hexokinase A [Castilleja foliolosa]|uniref:Hexokinase A n=1 Tax=Castilleja foliolosa TaxID=1961234 RepID=A0ABD3CAV5_9LAMI